MTQDNPDVCSNCAGANWWSERQSKMNPVVVLPDGSIASIYSVNLVFLTDEEMAEDKEKAVSNKKYPDIVSLNRILGFDPS